MMMPSAYTSTCHCKQVGSTQLEVQSGTSCSAERQLLSRVSVYSAYPQSPLTFSSTRLPLNCSGAMYMGCGQGRTEGKRWNQGERVESGEARVRGRSPNRGVNGCAQPTAAASCEREQQRRQQRQ